MKHRMKHRKKEGDILEQGVTEQDSSWLVPRRYRAPGTEMGKKYYLRLLLLQLVPGAPWWFPSA